MKWEAIVIIAMFTLSALSTVASIGKPRPPLTPPVAVGVLIFCGALIALAYRLGVA